MSGSSVTVSNAYNGSKSFRPYTASDLRNIRPDGDIYRSDTRYNFGINGRYRFSNRAEFIATYSHTAYDTSGNYTNTSSYNSLVQLNCDNPYLSAQQASLICGTSSGDPSVFKPVIVNYYPQGWQDRYTYQNRNDSITTQLKGQLNEHLRYEVNMNGFNFREERWRQGGVDPRRFTNAVRARMVDGKIVCLPPQTPIVPGSDRNGQQALADATCQPIDVFSTAPLSAAGFDYITGNTGASGNSNRQFVLNGTLAGHLPGLISPLARKPVGFSISAEHRVNRFGEYSSGGDLAVLPRLRYMSIISEVAGELSVPIMEDRPLVRSFQISGAGRYGRYSTYDGGATTWRLGFNYVPIEGLSFRGSVSRSIRVPIAETFAPTTIVRAVNGGLLDLCSPPTGTAVQRLSFAQCSTFGLTRQQYDALSSRTDCNASGVCPANLLQGGNLALRPEVGTTVTVGMTITPRALPGFSARFDLYKIKITDYFSSNDPYLAFASCAQGLSYYCTVYVRDPATGRLDVPGAYADNRSINAGYQDTRGLDINADYRFDVARLFGGKDLGSAGLTFLGNLRLKSRRQDFPTLPTFDCSGYWGILCSTPMPRWRHTLRAAWTLPWQDLTFTANWRYASAVRLSTLSPALRLKGRPTATDLAVYPLDDHLRASSYFDGGVSIRVMGQSSIRLNVLNLLDTQPRLVAYDIPGNALNTIPSLYDPLGRTIMLGFSAKF